MYNEEVMKHFRNPSNMGEIKDPDGVGEVGNMKCGDIMKIYIRVGTRTKNEKIKNKNTGSVGEAEEFIEDVKFQTLGCAAAIATSSVTTEMAKGKTLDEAAAITKDDINDALGKLPAIKYHCSVLADQGIKRAIEDYRSKRKNNN